MALIDFILNLAALLLWWNGLAIRFDQLAKTSAVSLVGTLRKADPKGPKRWRSLAALALLLFLRAVFYWEFTPAMHWTPALELNIVNLPFRSDYFGRMLLFSLLSFALALGIFYSWLLLFSIANARVPDTEPIQRLVRLHFKWLEPWPWLVKLLVPFFIGALLWLAMHPLLAQMSIVTKGRPPVQILEQAALVGIAAYLAWKYLIVGILLLHLLNSYVYLGNHALWNFINTTARNLLLPLRWLPLRIGKVDFLPLIAIALILFATESFSRIPMHYYLPF
jgi:uncharacterized protein YggT (Ycf19 family)